MNHVADASRVFQDTVGRVTTAIASTLFGATVVCEASVSGCLFRTSASERADGLVVVGWLGRGTTTLHCTHHALMHRLKVLSLSSFCSDVFIYVMYICLCCSVRVHSCTCGSRADDDAERSFSVSPILDFCSVAKYWKLDGTGQVSFVHSLECEARSSPSPATADYTCAGNVFACAANVPTANPNSYMCYNNQVLESKRSDAHHHVG